MNKELFAALDMLEKEKGISKEVLFEALEVALVSAYKRNFQNAPAVRVELDRETGEIKVFSQLTVVEDVELEQQEVSLYEAKVYDPKCQIGDLMEMDVTPKEFGRIAAQTAKQVVIQRIREAERELVFENFIDRIEEVINGFVRRFEQRNAIIDLGRTEAVLPLEEQIPHERFRQGERIKTYILDVKKTSKGPQIIVSRTNTGFLKRLFEMEVPEIFEGVVVVKAAAREAGYRSKLAVVSNNVDIDPVGACVGPKGSRVQAISNELKGEKIDIIKWSEESEEYIANSLSPAKVASVILNPETKMATVVVPDNQLSLAIGKEGQNARLAAKITGWKIDICSETQHAEKSLSAMGLAGDGETKKESELSAAELLGAEPKGLKPVREHFADAGSESTGLEGEVLKENSEPEVVEHQTADSEDTHSESNESVNAASEAEEKEDKQIEDSLPEKKAPKKKGKA